MANVPSAVLVLRDGKAVRALRHYHELSSDDVGREMGLSGRRIRQWEELLELDANLAERLRAAIEAAVLASVVHEEEQKHAQ